jgi:hypothetical protein
MVPYDCTLYPVGSGRANDDGTVSDEEDAEGEEEAEELEINSITWSLLRFHWIPEGFLSEAWFDGAYPRLNTQRPDQRWINKLLPSPYRADFARRTDDRLYGGLNGDLAILVALLAFSAYDGATCDVFEHSIRGVHVIPDSRREPGWRMHNRHEEEGCKIRYCCMLSWKSIHTDRTHRGRQTRVRGSHLDVGAVLHEGKPSCFGKRNLRQDLAVRFYCFCLG